MSPVLGSFGENINFEQMIPQSQQLASNSPVANLAQGAQQMFDSNAPVSVLAYGDLPMPISQPGLLTLPSPDNAAKLVQIYFDKFSPSILFLHRPSVERWAEELVEAGGNLLQMDYLKSRNAIVFMIFASAQTYSAKSESSDISILHYQVADEQLQSETGPPQLTGVQARLLQCFYLIARGRINQCWSTFSNVVSLIFTLGLNRNYSQRGIVDLIEVECQKRVFWAAFYLDKFLSYALARPQLLKIDDIDQELPKIINDRQFTPKNLIPASPATSSTNSTDSTDMNPKNVSTLSNHTSPTPFPPGKHKAASLIQALPEGLDEVQNRQRSELWLSYHHTKILLLRTYLLDPNYDMVEDDGMIGKLENACKYICQIVEPRRRGFLKGEEASILKHEFPIYADFVESVAFRSAWFPQYIIFTAATVTYIACHRNSGKLCKPDDTTMRKMEMLHAPLRKIVFPGSFMGVCVSVLDELKIAVEAIVWRRFSYLDGEEYEDDETRKEREDLERYMTMARETLKETGEDWNEDRGAGRDPSHVMSRFRSWGFSRLTNRMMERGL
ncbi:uncharacterized protein EAF01_006258 [Botrytis porri]|uniref:uncharacterized protein n=1 Tax=Botrytis porri TaxID=87229 RepID=UPI001900D82E|nr:uncharacterized protein EAF01_006258 [Botrytis porri]KAF7903209.1 hypothetical protein EAF01_006258 [Botrytis porri]